MAVWSLFTFNARETSGRRLFAYAYTMLSKDGSTTDHEEDIGHQQPDILHQKQRIWTRQKQARPQLLVFVADIGAQQIYRFLALQYLRVPPAGALFHSK